MNFFLWMNATTIVYILIGLSMITFFGLVIMALTWSLKSGQFENFERSAQAIFDPDEPIGIVTDSFPNKELKER